MSRRRRLLIAILVLAPAATGVAPDRADAAPHCPGVLAASCVAGTPLMPGKGVDKVAGDAIKDGAGAVAGAAGSAALDGIAGWVGNGASWLVKRIGRAVERSTRPELEAPWFDRQYQRMLQLAVLASLVFLLIALASSAIRGDLSGGLRAAVVALPAALIAAFAAVTLTQLFLDATDEATARLVGGVDGRSDKFFNTLAGVLGNDSPVPGFIALLGAVIAAMLCFVVWIELVLREAAIYLAVGFLPLSLAAMVWRRTAHLAKALVEGLVALILAKLTIAAAVAFAAAALTGADKGGVTVVLAGCATLFLAALSPWMLLKLIPLAGDQIALRRGSVGQAVRTAPGVSTAAGVVTGGMASAFTAKAMGAGAAASQPAPAAQAWKPTPPPLDGATPPDDPRLQRPESTRRGGGKDA